MVTNSGYIYSNITISYHKYRSEIKYMLTENDRANINNFMVEQRVEFTKRHPDFKFDHEWLNGVENIEDYSICCKDFHPVHKEWNLRLTDVESKLYVCYTHKYYFLFVRETCG